MKERCGLQGSEQDWILSGCCCFGPRASRVQGPGSAGPTATLCRSRPLPSSLWMFLLRPQEETSGGDPGSGFGLRSPQPPR